MGNTIRELANKIIFKSGTEKLAEKVGEGNFFSFEAVDIDGNLIKMSTFKDRKAIIIVNVACK